MRFVVMLIIISSSILISAKSYSEGENDGYLDAAYCARSSSDWFNMPKLIMSTKGDTINLETVYGTGTLVKALWNLTASDGYVYVKFFKGIEFIKIPIAAGQTTPKLPAVQYILNLGTTIDTIGCFNQKTKQP